MCWCRWGGWWVGGGHRTKESTQLMCRLPSKIKRTNDLKGKHHKTQLEIKYLFFFRNGLKGILTSNLNVF